jgi:hypothetical protein
LNSATFNPASWLQIDAISREFDPTNNAAEIQGNKLQKFLDKLNIPFQLSTIFAHLIEGIVLYLAVEMRALREDEHVQVSPKRKRPDKRKIKGDKRDFTKKKTKDGSF